MRPAVCSMMLVLALALGQAPAARAQTSITGSNLVLKSRGAQSGTTLSETGYLGTYLVVPAGGATVNFTVNATGSGAHMNVVVADAKFGFNVAGGAAANYTTQHVTLPEGTYLVRAERDYHNGANQSFTVNNLSVSALGGAAVTFSNVPPHGSTAAAAQANAMAAANTYIQHFRKGQLDLTLQGVAAGTSVQVRLKNSEFKFGTAVPDALATYLAADPTPGSRAAQYQQLLLQNFNSITPENGGKWVGSDTPTQLQQVDRMLSFAAANDLRVRQHTLVWGTQQPAYLNALFTNARSSNPAIAEPAKAAIQAAISARIDTYVGGINSETGGSTGLAPVVRATQYAGLDVYNESFNTGANVSASTNLNFWKVLGATEADGPAVTADILNRVQATLDTAGATTRLFTNDYNVLNNNSDQYGQWYSRHVESIRQAGGAVGGIGVQFYADAGVNSGGASVDPWRVYASLANLAAHGLPLEMTEFGTRVGSNPAGALAAAMTLAFGSPDMTGFTLWGFFADRPDMFDAAKGTVLYDANFNLTAAGQAYQQLRAAWTTDVTTTVGPDGRVVLPDGAFFGDYEVIVNGQTYQFTFDRSTSSQLVLIPEPSAAALLTVAALGAATRRKRVRTGRP